ncbi:MAG: M23 family metallopeptidase [Microgenomates group bacterium]
MNISLWLPKTRLSNPVSKLLRPFFEAKKAKTAFGGFLSAASLILAVGVYPFINQSPVSALEPVETSVEVETSISGPAKLLPNMKTISQGFWSAHPGIDITASKGSPIYPIRSGKVIEIAISRYNYGRSVLLDHGDGTTSLYAHMGKIYVDEGDEVTDTEPLGEVGMSGRTTGPHLHLEVRKNGVAQNPIKYLRATLASK